VSPPLFTLALDGGEWSGSHPSRFNPGAPVPVIQGDSGGVTTTAELISDDILSKKCHINLGLILNIYRVTFLFGFFSKFQF
jgi:hypothetical protein